MAESKEYSNLTLEELLTEAKKNKQKGTLSAFFIGLLVGIIIYAVAKNGIAFVPLFIPLFLIYVTYKGSQTIKEIQRQIQSEINAKS